MLLVAFVFAVYCKAPAELFVTFAGGLATMSGAFVYGNAKEHQANAKVATAQLTTQTPANP